MLTELLVAALADLGSATVRELVADVRSRGPRGMPRARIERVLWSDPRFVADGDALKARWRLADDADVEGVDQAGVDQAGVESPETRAGQAAATTPTSSRAHLDQLDLRPWQAEALATWSQSCRGVVEAVTGTGKTRLAMAAIRIVVDRGGRALVLVPTLELQDQWVAELRAVLGGVDVGRLGGGHGDDLFDREVVVATPHSAAAVPLDVPAGAPGLLVADEAHRYGAPTWGRALHEGFALRLALTATYERGDDGLVEVLEPYFGPLVHRYGYARAVADGTVAPFRIALAGVRLDDRERQAYDAADARVRQLHRELIGGHGMSQEPRQLFAAVAAVVAEADAAGRDGPQVRACREYLVRVRERRDIAATAHGKLDVCRQAAPALAGRPTLVFTDTVEQADAVARTLARAGLGAETVHGGLTTERRRIRLAQFRQGRIDALVAPRVLDEGVDVPDAEVGIVLAAFRTRRQLVQRLGRVLRLKSDGRAAQLVVACALDTAEDPARGGHRDFLAEVTDVAREVAHLDVAADVASWLGKG